MATSVQPPQMERPMMPSEGVGSMASVGSRQAPPRPILRPMPPGVVGQMGQSQQQQPQQGHNFFQQQQRMQMQQMQQMMMQQRLGQLRPMMAPGAQRPPQQQQQQAPTFIPPFATAKAQAPASGMSRPVAPPNSMGTGPGTGTGPNGTSMMNMAQAGSMGPGPAPKRMRPDVWRPSSLGPAGQQGGQYSASNNIVNNSSSSSASNYSANNWNGANKVAGDNNNNSSSSAAHDKNEQGPQVEDDVASLTSRSGFSAAGSTGSGITRMQEVICLKCTPGGADIEAPEFAEKHLLADWAMVLEMMHYMSADLRPNLIAVGTEEIMAAFEQGVVVVAFLPATSGRYGEMQVRESVSKRGRGYLVGPTHYLWKPLYEWVGVALLEKPLEAIRPDPSIYAEAAASLQLKRKRQDFDGPDVEPDLHDYPEGPLPQVTVRDLRHELRLQGRREKLEDRWAILDCAQAMRTRFLVALDEITVFKAFSDIFVQSKGEAHRKALLFVVYELFMGERGECMKVGNRRANCLKYFLLPIGVKVRAFPVEERKVYVKSVQMWKDAKVMSAPDMKQLKEAWDMD